MKLVPCSLNTLVRRNFLSNTLTSKAARQLAIDTCPCPKHSARRRRRKAKR